MGGEATFRGGAVQDSLRERVVDLVRLRPARSPPGGVVARLKEPAPPYEDLDRAPCRGPPHAELASGLCEVERPPLRVTLQLVPHPPSDPQR